MEGFSIISTCGAGPSWTTRGALLLVLVLTVRALIIAVRDPFASQGGHRHFETWVRRVFMVVFAAVAGTGSELRLTAQVTSMMGNGGLGATAAGAAESLVVLTVGLGSAMIIALMSVVAAMIAGRRLPGAACTTVMAWPRMYVATLSLLALLTVLGCLFVSRSITGWVSGAALQRGSRVAVATQIGGLVVLLILVVQSIRGRAKSRRMLATGQVTNRLFASTMIMLGLVSLLLCFYTQATILELQDMAMHPPEALTQWQ